MPLPTKADESRQQRFNRWMRHRKVSSFVLLGIAAALLLASALSLYWLGYALLYFAFGIPGLALLLLAAFNAFVKPKLPK